VLYPSHVCLTNKLQVKSLSSLKTSFLHILITCSRPIHTKDDNYNDKDIVLKLYHKYNGNDKNIDRQSQSILF